jgi:mannosyltransferase
VTRIEPGAKPIRSADCAPPRSPAVASDELDAPAWRRRATAAVTALVLTLLAGSVRAVCRPGRPMWFDEGYSIALARESWTTFKLVIGLHEVNGSLFYLLLRGAQRAADAAGFSGDLDLARGLAAAFGIATVPLLYAVGARLLDRATGVLAAALLAVNQFHAYFSLEARTYTLAALLATASSYLLVRALDAPALRRFAPYVIAMGLSAYAHFFSAFVFAAHLAVAPLHPSLRAGAPARGRRRAIVGLVLSVAGVAFAAWPLVTFVRHGDVGQVSWIARTEWATVSQFFLRIAGYVRVPAPVELPGDTLRSLEVALAAVAIGAWVLASRRRERRRAFGYAFAVALFVAPLGLTLAVSHWKPLFVDRYLMVAVPGWMLLVAAGLTSSRRAWVVAPAAVVIGALSLSGTLRPHPWDLPPAYRNDDLARHVLSRAEPGDALVFSFSANLVPFQHHWRELGFAPDAAEIVEPFPLDPLAYERHAWPDQRPLSERIGAYRRVWFILSGEQPEVSGAREALARDAAVLDDAEFDYGLRAVLYERARARDASPGP